MDNEQQVRDVATQLWEVEGRPEGRALEHWKKAEMILDMFNVVSRQLDQLTRQLDAKDIELRVKDQQLADRSREIEELHRMLIQAQAMTLAASERRPAWWRRWLQRRASPTEAAPVA